MLDETVENTTMTEGPTTATTLEPVVRHTLPELVNQVCNRIPPLWDLSNYVAVNPFLGFADQPLPDAAQTITDGITAKVLPNIAFYRARWQAGAFGPDDVRRVAERHGKDATTLLAILNGTQAVPTRDSTTVLTFAERHDRQFGTRLNEALINNATLWCAVQVPTENRLWDLERERGLFASWLETARVDRALEIAGLPGWRSWAKELPNDPQEAIAAMLDRAGLTTTQREGYLYRLMAGVFGWASFLRRGPWEAKSDDAGPVADLLAIRVCSDVAVQQLAPRSGAAAEPVALPPVPDEHTLVLFQEVLEDAYARNVLSTIAPPPAEPSSRPAVQSFFCIDVRSEVLRRHLEAQSPQVQTMGFAGFFGVTLDWQADGKSSARCPVLLQPGVHVASQATAPGGATRKVLKDIQKAPGAAFTFVETIGLAYGLGLAGDAMRWFQTARPDEATAPFSLEPDDEGRGLPLEARIATAAFILKNTGLRETFGRLVLLCGHASTSENNSHAAGLDCGACGGHGGAINARIACALLNQTAVRTGLVEHGWQIPEDTFFVPGLHDTTNDIVQIYDTEELPTSHAGDIAQLRAWLELAGAGARAERAGGLGLSADQSQSRSMLFDLIWQRSRDWSEVRPEWALARNAAFITARRDRTRGVNLDGRSFLHEYDWTTDPDNSILTLVLSAPMVVASWINLQYFASTVDNDMFGGGTKALHNRIGSLGVVLGNGGDLRTGLALQSVQDADGSWYHEPMRLQVIVEAPRERIEAVMEASADVRNLIEQGWVRLFALDYDSNEAVRWVPGTGWDTP